MEHYFAILKSSKLLIHQQCRWISKFHFEKKGDKGVHTVWFYLYGTLRTGKMNAINYWIVILLGTQIAAPLTLHIMKTEAAETDWQSYKNN